MDLVNIYGQLIREDHVIKSFSNPQAISNSQKKEKSIKSENQMKKKNHLKKKKINKDINLLTCLLNLINEKSEKRKILINLSYLTNIYLYYLL